MPSLLTSADLAAIAQDATDLRDTYATSVEFSNILPLEQQPDYHPQLGWIEGAEKLRSTFTLDCIVVPMAQAKMRGLFATKRRVETQGGDVPVGDVLVEVVSSELESNTLDDTTFLTVGGITYRASAVEDVGPLKYVYATKTPATEDLVTPIVPGGGPVGGHGGPGGHPLPL